MNNRPIKTYEDLLQEEQRLTAHLATLKVQIKADIGGVKQGIKEKLSPVKKIKTKVQSLFSQEGRNGPALNFLINFVLDYIIRKIIPNRTSVWTKTVVPFLTKNYVSHLITDQQRDKILGFVNKTVGKIDHFIRKTFLKKQEDHFEKEAAKPDVAAATHQGVTDMPPIATPGMA